MNRLASLPEHRFARVTAHRVARAAAPLAPVATLLLALVLLPAIPLLPPVAGLAAQQAAASALSETDFDALELRDIGPAINGGRIADSDFHPDDPSIWYVAVGSGGVWRTENAGTTWTPGPVR